MDRESTPVKQRQKRGASRKSAGSGSAATSTATSGASGSSARAFRPSNSANQRSRSRTTAGSGASALNTPAPAAILAKPTILRASVAGSAPSSSAAGPALPPTPTATLWEPSDSRRASASSTSSGAAFRASAGGLQRSGSGLMVNTRSSGPSAAAPSPSGRRSPAVTRKASMPPPAPSPLVQQQLPHRHAQPKLPPTRVKLVTSALQFATDLASKLGGCLEVSNLTVVGVLGLDGVGKSTVASLLSQKERDGDGNSMFPPQSLETVALGRNETAGVDMAVVPNGPGLVSSNHHRHLVLLDAQPVLSGALLADLLAKSESSSSVSVQQQQQRGFFNPPAALSAEQQIDVASHQLAVFLASVCHYVIVVHDALASEDPEDALLLSRFMRDVQQKLEQCRLPHISGGQIAGRKHVAKLLFVANNASTDEAMESERLQRHVAALETMWGAHLLVRARRSGLTPVVIGNSARSSLARGEAVETPTKGRRRSKPQIGGGSSSPSGTTTPSPTKRVEGRSEREEDEGVPMFILPHNSSLLLSQQDESPGKPKSKASSDESKTKAKAVKAARRTRDSRAFDNAAEALHRFVRALPADATFASAPSPTSVLPTEANARPLTLREWLSNASRVFDGVRKSSVFTAEYAAGR